MTNLKDTHKSKTIGLGASGNSDKSKANINYAKIDKEQNTKGTLGKGNIKVEDKKSSTKLASINRDIKNSQELIKNKEIKDIGINLVHKSEDMKKQEADNSWSKTGERLGEGVGEALSNVGGNKEDVAKLANKVENTYDVLTDNNVNNLLGIVPSKGNYGGLTQQIPILLGKKDPNHEILGEKNSKNVYINGILNNKNVAIIGANDIIGDNKDKAILFNPTHGVIGDLLEAAVDKWGNSVGMQTGISKQTEEYLKNNEKLKVYMHSQGNLITQEGAKKTVDNKHIYNSYGAPLSDEKLKSIFDIKKPNKNPKDPISYPSINNLFLNPNYSQHFTNNYGASKKEKEEIRKEKK